MPQTDPALMSAEEMLGLFERRALSPVEALAAVRTRVARLNPELNAFACFDERAEAAAADSEGRWLASRPMGLLDGVPCTVKDLVDIAGLPTRRGSRTTEDAPQPHDAPLVLGLKREGAIIIGKTTTTEFGWKSPGDCPLHGITRNPWDTRRSTGGSSSGAGAAAAAGFGPLHVGTDAGGSIRLPAAWCGAVGVKPSFGRVPQWPAGTFAAVSCAGPITRTVRDAALMLSALARFDLRDPYCLPDDPRDWRDGIEDGVAGLRVAILRRPGFDAPLEADRAEAVDTAAGLLAEAGALVAEADPGLPDTHVIFGQVWGAALSRLWTTTPAQLRTLLDPALAEVAQAQQGMSAAAYLDGEATRLMAANAMAQFMQMFDLVLCPTVPSGPQLADAPTVNAAEALWREWAPWTFTFNLTRQPAITVPMPPGADGMPRAVQIAAALYRDDLVLRAARALELASPPAQPRPL